MPFQHEQKKSIFAPKKIQSHKKNKFWTEIYKLVFHISDNSEPPFKFCMLFAPFMSCCSKHRSYFDENTTSKAKIPSLFVVGNGDQVVDPRRSEALLAFFERPHLIHHDGGHYVPATGKQKQSYLEFLQARLSEKISA